MDNPFGVLAFGFVLGFVLAFGIFTPNTDYRFGVICKHEQGIVQADTCLKGDEVLFTKNDVIK